LNAHGNRKRGQMFGGYRPATAGGCSQQEELLL